MSANNIQVAIKVRPVLKKEEEAKILSIWKTKNNSIQSADSTYLFHFDHIFDEHDSNEIIFNKIAKPIIDATLKGFNGTIFAYGQTSSGKTYTMLGDEKNPGVMCLAAKEIFQEIVNASDKSFLLRVGYIEIYNEKIYDLLNKSNQDLKIHESNGEVIVNCSEFIIRSEEELMEYLHAGSKLRKCGETNMNERSSRSHAIFRLIIESRDMDKINDDGAIQISNLNLVDLAGSERADQTGATGSRLIEGSHINRSLLSLSCVIKRLSENIADQYINYRDSKLTRILQASLGGNALTAIVCAINPTSFEETNSTLNFAMRAKTIKNKPRVNEILTDAAMMKRLEKEISRLKSALELEKHRSSKIKVLELEKQIKEENLKIVNCHSIGKTKKSSRRRTWHVQTIPEEEAITADEDELNKQYSNNEEIESKNKINCFFTPQLITVRGQQDNDDFSRDIDLKFNGNANLNTFINSSTSRVLTPPPSNFELNDVELELEELKNFTNLEKTLKIDFEPIKTLCERLENANDMMHACKIEKIAIQNELKDKIHLFEDLETKFTETERSNEIKFRTLEETNLGLKNDVMKLQKENYELKMKTNILADTEIKYELSEKKLKLRIEELLDRVKERELEIKNLNYCISNTQPVNSSIVECASCLNNKNVITSLRQNIQIKESEILSFIKLINNLEENKNQMQFEYDNLSSQLVESIEECDELKNKIKQNEIDDSDLKQLNKILEDEKNCFNKSLLKIYEESIESFLQINNNNKILEETVSLFQEKNKIYLEENRTLRHKLNLNDEKFKILQNQNNQHVNCNLQLNNDVINLKKSVTALHNELNDQTKHFTLRQKDFEKIENKFSELKLLYTTISIDNEKLKEIKTKYEKDFSIYIEKLSILESDKEELQNKLNEVQIEYNVHLKDFQVIESKYMELQLLYNSIENDNKELKQENINYEKDLFNYIEQHSVEPYEHELQKKIFDLESKFNNQQKDFEKIETKYIELQTLYTSIENHNKELKEKIINYEKNLSNYIEKHLILESDKKDLQCKLNDLQSKYNDQQNEYNKWEKDLEQINTKYAELQLLYTSISNDNEILKKMNTKHKNDISIYIEQLLNLESDKKESQNNLNDLQSEYNDNLKHLKTIESKYTELQLLYTTMENNNKDLKEENSNYEKNLSNCTEQNSKQKKIAELESKYNDQQNKFNMQQNDFDNMKSKYTELQALYISIENDNKNLKEKNTKYEKDLSNYIEHHLILETDKKDLECNLNDLQSKYNDQQDDFNMQHKDFENMKTKYTELQLLYTSISNDNEILKKTYTKYEKDISIYIEKLSILESDKKDLQNNLNELQSEYNDQLKKFKIIESKCTELQLLYTTIENDNKDLKEKNTNYEKELSNYIEQNSKEKKLDELESKYNDQQISTLLKNIENMKNEYNELLALYTSIENDKKNLNEKISNYEKQISNYNEQHSILENDKKDLQCKLNDVRSKYNDQQDDFNIQLKEFENIKTKYTELQTLYTSIENHNKELKEKIINYEKNLSNYIEKDLVLESDKKNLQCKLNDLQSKYNDQQNEFNKCEKDLEKNENKYVELQTLYSSIKSDNQNLKEKNSNFEKDLSNYVEQHSILETCKKELQTKLDDLKSKYTDRLNELNMQQKDLEKVKIKCSELQTFYTSIENDNKMLKESNIKNVEEYGRKISTLEAIINESKVNIKNNKKYEEEIKKLNCIVEQKVFEISQIQSKNDLINSEIQNNYLGTPRSIIQNDRKSRRQSMHDESREFLCNIRDVAVETDPTDKLCRCDELNIKILSLQKSLTIKNSQLSTLKMELKSNAYTEEIDCLKKKILNDFNEKEKLQDKYSKLQQYLIVKSRNLQTKSSQTYLNNISVSSQTILNYISVSSQTNLNESLNEIYDELKQQNIKLNAKYQQAANLCNHRKDEINKLVSKLNSGKENHSNNSNQIIDINEFNVLKTKYNEAKQVLIIRGNKIEELSEIIEKLKNAK